MDKAKFIPWLLTAILSIICWQQQQTIYSLEIEKTAKKQQNSPEIAIGKIQKSVIDKRETKMGLPSLRTPLQIPQNQILVEQSNSEQTVSNQEMEDIIEHRALERLEEIEEEKRQKRVEQLTDQMQTQVDGWGKDFNWTVDTQNSMMDIMTDYVHGRVEVHVLLKNGTIERDGIRPYFQQIANERNEAIIELVGSDEFSEMEENLHPRGGKK